jgi:hypothetical protein
MSMAQNATQRQVKKHQKGGYSRCETWRQLLREKNFSSLSVLDVKCESSSACSSDVSLTTHVSADCVLLMSMDKKEVIPVDTHVQQIAVKHYGFRKGSSGSKVTMTPKLYDEVNEKLTSIWGPYAGWAHSV